MSRLPANTKILYYVIVKMYLLSNRAGISHSGAGISDIRG